MTFSPIIIHIGLPFSASGVKNNSVSVQNAARGMNLLFYYYPGHDTLERNDKNK